MDPAYVFLARFEALPLQLFLQSNECESLIQLRESITETTERLLQLRRGGSGEQAQALLTDIQGQLNKLKTQCSPELARRLGELDQVLASNQMVHSEIIAQSLGMSAIMARNTAPRFPQSLSKSQVSRKQKRAKDLNEKQQFKAIQTSRENNDMVYQTTLSTQRVGENAPQKIPKQQHNASLPQPPQQQPKRQQHGESVCVQDLQNTTNAPSNPPSLQQTLAYDNYNTGRQGAQPERQPIDRRVKPQEESHAPQYQRQTQHDQVDATTQVQGQCLLSNVDSYQKVEMSEFQQLQLIELVEKQNGVLLRQNEEISALRQQNEKLQSRVQSRDRQLAQLKNVLAKMQNAPIQYPSQHIDEITRQIQDEMHASMSEKSKLIKSQRCDQ